MKDEVERANRVLGGGFGSYVGGAVVPGGGALPGALVGQAMGYATQPFGSKESAYKLLEKRARVILAANKRYQA